MEIQTAKRKLNHVIEHPQKRIGKSTPVLITAAEAYVPVHSPDEEAATILARKMCELLDDLRSREMSGESRPGGAAGGAPKTTPKGLEFREDRI